MKLVTKHKWLSIEDLVSMMPVGTVMESSKMTQLVEDHNKGLTSLDDIKKIIKESKKQTLKEFLGK